MEGSGPIAGPTRPTRLTSATHLLSALTSVTDPARSPISRRCDDGFHVGPVCAGQPASAGASRKRSSRLLSGHGGAPQQLGVLNTREPNPGTTSNSALT